MEQGQSSRSRTVSKKGQSSGKDNDKAAGGILPQRIFQTNRYPPEGRINSYSKPEYLLDIVQCLEGTPEFEKLMESPFGCLFQLPVRKCSLSGKLVHNILCRGLVTKKEHELWFVFGGYPFRFSIREFAIIIGLPCGEYPPPETIKDMQAPPEGENRYWDTLIGSSHATSIQEIVNMLKRDQRKPEEKKMPGWRRLRLALIVIVEGILICGSQPVRASIEVVKMVRNLESFMAYPWGRESFELTLRMIKVGTMIGDINNLVDKLLQSHTLCHGFPLAIQLFIFQSIPLLGKYLPDESDETFAETVKTRLTKLKTYHNNNIMQSEYDPAVEVDIILHTNDPFDEDGPVPFKDVEDPSVEYLLTLIDQGHKFKMNDWQGGYGGCALMTPNVPKAVKGKRKEVNEKKGKKQRTERSRPQLVDEETSSESDDILYEIEVLNYAHTLEVKKWFESQKSLLKEQLKREIIAELLRSGWSNRNSGAHVNGREMDQKNAMVDEVVSLGDVTPVDEFKTAEQGVVSDSSPTMFFRFFEWIPIRWVLPVNQITPAVAVIIFLTLKRITVLATASEILNFSYYAIFVPHMPCSPRGHILLSHFPFSISSTFLTHFSYSNTCVYYFLFPNFVARKYDIR